MNETPGLEISRPQQMQNATMLLAFTGWMDGGEVSTGTIQRLIEQMRAPRFASIDPEGYYIYNFPGAMEIATLFRPQVQIEGGRIVQYLPPENSFHVDVEHRLVLFHGKEPHLNWRAFGQCLLEVARQTGVTRIIFVGSFGGSVPHTREPRLYATLSHDSLRPMLERYNLRPSTYAGPGSFATYLMTQVGHRNLEMLSLVAEIPGYLQGVNPTSIEAVTRRLAGMFNLEVDLPNLRHESDAWEAQVTAAVQKDDDLALRIRQLEQEYDDDLLDVTKAKTWFGDKEAEPPAAASG